MGAKTLLTVEQFQHLPETEGVSFELDEGELIEVSGPILSHGRIQRRILMFLANFLSERKVPGEVVTEQEFRLSADTVRCPDVAFVGAANLAGLEGNESVQAFPPDLAIEITSPSDTFDSLLRKTRQYLNAGTKAVWIVALQEVHVYTAGPQSRVLTAEQTIEDPALLPGFSARVAAFFED